MKITNGIDSTSSLERPATDQAGSARAKPAASVATGSDTIRISELSTHLAAIEGRFSTEGAFDAKRVDEIKQAMRDGHFKVNAEAVADKLLDSVREMLRKPS